MPTEINPTPLTDEAAALEARRIIDAAYRPAPTSFRDDTPLPVVGTTPPVPQPGRPPMSQAATDASALMLSGSVLTMAVGGTGSLVMYASGYADPIVCAIVFGAPAALVLALSRLMRRAKDVLPSEHHHHYRGPVTQTHQTVHNENRWLGRSTTTQPPRG